MELIKKLFLMAACVSHLFGNTQDHIDQLGLENLQVQFSQSYDQEVFEQFQIHLPWFLDIVEKEKEGGVFGYHGTSLEVGIYHEIVKQVIEKTLEVELPSNFYFFRVPGDPLFNLPEGAQTFFNIVESDSAQFLSDRALELFLLTPLKEEAGVTLKTEALTLQEKKLCMDGTEKFKIYFNEFLHTTFKGEMPSDPVLLARKASEYKQKNPQKWLAAQSMQTRNKDIADLIFKKGVFDMTLSKKWLVAWLFKNNGLDRSSSLFFNSLKQKKGEHAKRYLQPFNNYKPDQRARLISLNFSLFANMENPSSCTVGIFLTETNRPVANEELIGSLEDLFLSCGYNPGLAREIFNEALENASGINKGIIYQFIDLDARYGTIDKNAFVSMPGGLPAKQYVPSHMVNGQIPFLTSSQNYFQLRLLMTNGETLNPFHKIRMNRYVPGPYLEKFAERIKERLNNEASDPLIRENYRDHLFGLFR
jgi:hypothetical protein